MIIVSHGHHKFITGPTAVEAYKNGLLSGFITAGYPLPILKQWWITSCKLDRYASIKRVLQRQEVLLDALVHSIWLSEMIYIVARNIVRFVSRFEHVTNYVLQFYAWEAKIL